jgi:DNA invertase Pin-like site-specific DNA recombinase
MVGIAFSYLRFSTPEQASGDSRRRQLAMAEKYAADHHLKLDLQLSFRDLGVSAFRGENAKEGALRAFLEAIEHNLVPQGSFLLVESLDRLSRDQILAAQSLFLQIVQAGITIVTLVDQRSYSIESLNRNPIDLIISLVVMMRANEESQTKSHRIREVFAQKRSHLAERPWSARCPGWLRLDKAQGKFVVVEERANIIRRIYREALAGVGHQTIARRLNEEGVSLFGQGNQRGKLWNPSLIRHFLRYPAVIGDFTPTVTEFVDGMRRARPQTTVPNYFPAVVDQADWDRVQAIRAEWSKHHKNTVSKAGRANLLAGLSRCPHCDSYMVLLSSSNPNWRYLTCRKANFGLGCSDRWIRYPGIEDTFTHDIDEVIRGCPKPVLDPDIRSSRLEQIRRRLHVLRGRLASIQSEYVLVRRINRPSLANAERVEAEMQQLLDERKALRIDRPRWLDVTLAARLAKLREAARAIDVDRHALNTILRSLLVRVVVDWEHDRLMLHWKHGGQSVVPVLITPLRVVSNRRRSDRPRLGPGRVPAPLPVSER